ncbi:MAG: hypothetical protein ACT4PM_01490 [Gemmatimonadales bacterium]
MRNRRSLLSIILPLASLIGCLARGEPEPGRVPDTAPSPLADSLVLSAPGGVTVWLTEGRVSSDSGGNACVERSIEIRRDTSRLKVPLLYTVTLPVLLDDSTLRADLAERCRPARAYRVNLRTAMPSPLDGGR